MPGATSCQTLWPREPLQHAAGPQYALLLQQHPQNPAHPHVHAPPPTPDPQSPESSLRLGWAGSRAPAIQQLLRPARALCRSHPSSFSTQSQCLRHDGHPTLLRAAQKPNWGTLGACLGNSERQEAKDTGGAAVQHSSCGSRGSQERGRRQRHPRRVCCRAGPQMRGGSGAGGSADCI